ncbi:MAG: hypothetical protein QOE41_1358 [Mycobacterium sp.]|jgi:hypothetical protein|nr:hypothetical protein [Mycobacterium sp.]MDT5132047.1 hypothetical protein [Mycobacterium sp.]
MSSAPRAAVGNLRFTANGVYAEYLLSGVPFIFLSEQWQNAVAAEHAELWRTLPSGAQISGLTVPVPTRTVLRKMLAADDDPGGTGGDAWARHCRAWEPTLARHATRRRIYWLSLPLTYGRAGRTPVGSLRRVADVVIGKDSDSAESLAYYRELGAEMVAALPPAFFPKPATVEQIWWHWNYVASRGVWHHPLPTQALDPHASLPASAFSPAYLDEAAAALRGRRWRAARCDADAFVRVFREPGDEVADSYQALLPLQDFPDSGIVWPRSTLFKALDDLSGPNTVLDWTIHATFQPTEAAVASSHNVVTNITDQFRQRGRHAGTDDELMRKLASGRELASELKRGTAERGVNVAIVLAAGAAEVDDLNRAVAAVTTTFRRQDIGFRRWRGGQGALWRAFVPGGEGSAAVGEFRNPTTTERFAKFVPLLASKLGNNTGVPLGVCLTSPGLCDVVLLDLLNAPARDNGANLVICGSPGRGKSHISKLLVWSWLLLGAGVHIFDPSEPREHKRALTDFGDKVVIDLADPGISVDPLRVFPYADAAEHAADHLLPLLGYSAVSRQAARLHLHLAPETRESNGIGSIGRLIGYLRALRERDSADDDLLVGLEGLRVERHLRALFDEALPVADLSSAAAVIWNTAGLELPTVGEEYAAHLHRLTTPRQRAGLAVYGLAADLSQTVFFGRRDHPDVLVVEEAAPLTNSPAGQKCCNRIIRQGRKSWTGFVGISQHPIKDFAVLEDEFIDQRLCLGFKDPGLARATLQWCGRDLDRHPELLRMYVENTSPVQLVNHGDDAIDSWYGKVIPGREGEGWFLDEFGGFGKVRLFEAPTARLAVQLDTNPKRSGRRT